MVYLARPGPDRPIPQALEWLVIPAYPLTLAVSMLGLRSLSMIGALLLCIALGYFLWSVLSRRKET